MSTPAPDEILSNQQSTHSRKPRLVVIAIAVAVVLAIAVAAIAFFALQKPGGKEGAESLVRDYLTAISEGRVADAHALVSNAAETESDAASQQVALDAATERITNIAVSEATEVEADVVGFGVPYSYSIAGSESTGEFLVMEGEDGELALKIDEGAGIVATPEVQIPANTDESLPVRPSPKVAVAGIPFSSGGDLPLYPGVYPVEVEQSYYFAVDANDARVSSVVVGSSVADPAVRVIADGEKLTELVDGTNAAEAAKKAADAHFPSCNTTTDTKEVDESCGELQIFVSSPVSKGTYSWTFGDSATIEAAMSKSTVDSRSTPARATIQDDGSILQSFEATVPVSVDFSEYLPLTNYTFNETKTGTSTLVIDVVTHADGTQETYPGGKDNG